MNEKQRIKTSKFLSLVLRHRPERVGLKLGENGWVNIQELLDACIANQNPISIEQLKYVVENCDKQRFAFSEDGVKIRASQGHSKKVDLGYQPVEPPDILYHGTVDQFLDSIFRDGLKKQKRHHVHLSKDIETATIVGTRRGKPVLLKIQSGKMHQDSYEFYCSENGVWLVESVPPKYITEN